jgi:negative regulator of sigma E activity
MNIDDIKLQLYVDGELDKNEAAEVDKFIKVNPAAKKKVEEYRQINNLLFEKYKSIEQENIPQRTVDLLIKEKKSFFKKLFNYEIKLVNALATACVVLIVFTVTNLNFGNKNLDNLNVKGKTSILNELSNIIGEENISTLTSNINQLNIRYKTKREFKNNVNENCKEIQFFDFKLNDINIDEAIFCEDKLIKLKFYKGDLKPI